MNNFETAIEAQKLVTDLRRQLKTINYNPDLKKMVANLDVLVDDLSKAEVQARQAKAPRSAGVENSKQRLKDALEYAEKMIFLARFL